MKNENNNKDPRIDLDSERGEMNLEDEAENRRGELQVGSELCTSRR